MRPSFNVSMAEDELAGARGSDAQLALAFAHPEAGIVSVDDERGDSLVSLRRIHGGEDQEQSGFTRVADPQFLPVEHPVVTFGLGPAGQCKGVRPRSGFGQRVGPDRVPRHPGQVGLLLFDAAPAQDRVVEQCVLHVDQRADRRIRSRDLLDRQAGLEKARPGPAQLLRDLDAHQAHLEQALQQGLVVTGVLLHLARFGSDLGLGVVANGITEHRFFFGQHGQCERGSVFTRHVRAPIG